jgi:carbonic anhydrase
LATVAADGETFSYVGDAANGPSNWAELNVTDNACDGKSQSGIDIPSSSCGVFDSYKFTVST